MTTEHTPTPWVSQGSSCYPAKDADAAPGLIAKCADAPRSPQVCIANAAFVVRAVNSHDALVKALEELLWCDGSDDYEEDGFHALTPHDETLKTAQAALRLAKGSQS